MQCFFQIQIEIKKDWCTADMRIVKSIVSGVAPSSERNMNYVDDVVIIPGNMRE